MIKGDLVTDDGEVVVGVLEIEVMVGDLAKSGLGPEGVVRRVVTVGLYAVHPAVAPPPAPRQSQEYEEGPVKIEEGVPE